MHVTWLSTHSLPVRPLLSSPPYTSPCTHNHSSFSNLHVDVHTYTPAAIPSHK